ncbi:MAG TPA: hypothetical protein VME68_04810 [Acidobacteriaceae bacterium]|nr:hypothetical protein [Acidobacteriaceae bacterium]
MRLSRFAFAMAVPPLGLLLIACGMPANPTGELQSITVSPATADRQGHAVQFTATGHWSGNPKTVTPQPAHWGVCQNNARATAVTVSSTGLAHCGSGASGRYQVFAADPPFGSPGAVCDAITACGGGCQISGSATLTCP